MVLLFQSCQHQKLSYLVSIFRCSLSLPAERPPPSRPCCFALPFPVPLAALTAEPSRSPPGGSVAAGQLLGGQFLWQINTITVSNSLRIVKSVGFQLVAATVLLSMLQVSVRGCVMETASDTDLTRSVTSGCATSGPVNICWTKAVLSCSPRIWWHL